MEDDFDLDLLLSVAGGLGRWQEADAAAGKRVYVKDDDCLGECSGPGGACEVERGVLQLAVAVSTGQHDHGRSALAGGHAAGGV
jgi:hypothetical protein